MARIKYFDPADNTWKYADNVAFFAPVLSVNGKTGAIIVTAEDVGAEPAGAVSAHNADKAAHADMRTLLANAMMKSDISTQKAQLTLEDGTKVLIDVVVASDGTTIETYTNQIPLSVDADGSIYNGIGYKEGYRLSSSGAEKENTGYIHGTICTGFIPVKQGDVVRIHGCSWYNPNSGTNYFCGYNDSFTFQGAAISNFSGYYGTWVGAELQPTHKIGENGDITFTITDPAVKYIRVSSAGTTAMPLDPAAAIIPVNEEIL